MAHPLRGAAVLSLLLLVLPAATVRAAPPTAGMWFTPAFGHTEEGDGLGTLFRLSPGGSGDGETSQGDLLVRWDWDGDGAWDTAWGTFHVAYHAYTQGGVYHPRLEVLDGEGLTDTQVGPALTVEATRPLAFGVPAQGVLAEPGQSLFYRIDVPDRLVDADFVLDWDGTVGANLDLFEKAGARPDENYCSLPCRASTSLATEGTEGICVRFPDPGVHYVRIARNPMYDLGGSDVSFTLAARQDNLDPTYHVARDCVVYNPLPHRVMGVDLPAT